MATFTPLGAVDAARVAHAHGLGDVAEVVPIAAGSVNSNYVLKLADRTVFVRLYEEQETDGVAFEWALLRHLIAAGLPIPARLAADPDVPGALRVGGRPVALFAFADGEMSCQSAVDAARAHTVGALLARTHRAGETFGWRRRSRFGRPELRARLASADASGAAAEIQQTLARLVRALDDIDAHWPGGLPTGVIHGDLFRDNVLWRDQELVAAIDWESASTGAFAYDLATTMLAWCVGDALDASLVGAFLGGYQSVRRLEPVERAHFRTIARSAAVRFTATRITDFELRALGGGKKKDYRRFRMRLDAIEAWSDADVQRLLA